WSVQFRKQMNVGIATSSRCSLESLRARPSNHLSAELSHALCKISLLPQRAALRTTLITIGHPGARSARTDRHADPSIDAQVQFALRAPMRVDASQGTLQSRVAP